LRIDVPTLDEEDVREISSVFTKIIGNKENKLSLALRRLNFCYLRDNEEDSLLDAVIAMEILLTDKKRQEMTHKLALRMAALISLHKYNKEKPGDIFKRVKRIYDYRSNLIHGNKKEADKLSEIEITKDEKTRTVSKAIEYLRMALSVLIDNPEYLDPNKIDHQLIIDKLNSEK